MLDQAEEAVQERLGLAGDRKEEHRARNHDRIILRHGSDQLAHPVIEHAPVLCRALAAVTADAPGRAAFDLRQFDDGDLAARGAGGFRRRAGRKRGAARQTRAGNDKQQFFRHSILPGKTVNTIYNVSANDPRFNRFGNNFPLSGKRGLAFRNFFGIIFKESRLTH